MGRLSEPLQPLFILLLQNQHSQNMFTKIVYYKTSNLHHCSFLKWLFCSIKFSIQRFRSRYCPDLPVHTYGTNVCQKCYHLLENTFLFYGKGWCMSRVHQAAHGTKSSLCKIQCLFCMAETLSLAHRDFFSQHTGFLTHEVNWPLYEHCSSSN